MPIIDLCSRKMVHGNGVELLSFLLLHFPFLHLLYLLPKSLIIVLN